MEQSLHNPVKNAFLSTCILVFRNTTFNLLIAPSLNISITILNSVAKYGFNNGIMFNNSSNAIYTNRVLMLITILSYPIMGLLFNAANSELNDSILTRILFAFLVLLCLVLSYYSKYFLDKIQIIAVIIFYILTIHTMYLCVINHFFDGYKYGLIVLISAAGFVFNNKKDISIYTALILIWIGIVDILSIEFINNEFVYFLIIGLALLVSIVFIHTKEIDQKELLLSDKIVQNANSFILMFNSKGDLVFTNPIVGKVLGQDQESLLGDGWWKFRRRNSSSIYTDKNRVQSLIQGDNPLHFDYRNSICSNENDLIWMDWQISIIDNQLILIGNDITSAILFKKKHAELSIAAQSMSDMIIVADHNDNITWVNDAFTHITGYTFREVLGKNPGELLLSKKCPSETLRYIEEQIQHKNSFEAEVINRAKSGKEIWVSIRTNLTLNSNGAIENYITVGHDITETKKSNKKLEHYVKRVSIMHDFDKVIISSKSLFDIINYMLGILINSIGSCNRVCYFDHQTARNKIIVVKDIANDRLNFHYDMEFDFENFPYRDKLLKGENYSVKNLSEIEKHTTFETTLSNLGVNSFLLVPIMCNNKLTSILNISSSDINAFSDKNMEIINEITAEFSVALQQRILQTSIKEKNKILKQKNDKLQKLNEELNELAYVISHDIKAPLRSITTLTDFIAIDHEEKIGGSGVEQLRLLKGRALRMNSLIDGMLAYTQIGNELGRVSAISSKILIEQSIKSFEVPKQIEIIINDEENLPTIKADVDKIELALKMLISNAIKYCNKNNGLIEIGCDKTDDTHQFYVSNNGIPIDHKHQERIFKLFRTLAPKDQIESTGIGLTIAKKIINLHNGSIWFESIDGIGTKFLFNIPIELND